jgi:hypothetical protein
MPAEKITTRATTPILYQRLAPYWCDTCMQLVTMISIEEATIISRMSAEAFCRKIEERCLHVMQTSSGAHFICLRSLKVKR